LCITDKMATLQAIEKNAAEAHAHVRVVILLLEEQASTITLEAEVAAATLQLVSTTAFSSSTPPPPPSGGDAVIVAMLQAQAFRVQNIHSLVLTVLDPASTCITAAWPSLCST
jgi:hypothetical protein